MRIGGGCRRGSAGTPLLGGARGVQTWRFYPIQMHRIPVPTQLGPPGAEPRPPALWGKEGGVPRGRAQGRVPGRPRPCPAPASQDVHHRLGAPGAFSGITEPGALGFFQQRPFPVWDPVTLRGSLPRLRPGQGPCGGQGSSLLPPTERAQREAAQVGAAQWGWGSEEVRFVPASWFQVAGTGSCRLSGKGTLSTSPR